MDYTFVYYTKNMKDIWDSFILNTAINGTFLHTRHFLEYHPKNYFTDCSLLIYHKTNLVAVIPACITFENNKKIFYSHFGSTFGGLVIAETIYNTQRLELLIEELEEYLIQNDFYKVYFRLTAQIFSSKNLSLFSYLFYLHNYIRLEELNFYINLSFKRELLDTFSSSTRRYYRKALKNNLIFKELDSKESIYLFYQVLQHNLQKYKKKAVHTLEELYDLKFNRFPDRVKFFGVYKEGLLVAGSMIFVFDEVYHSQYLAALQEQLIYYPMDFLMYNLIQEARLKDMKYFSMGISTENQGKYLNRGLSRFKEGFGTEYCINYSYEKILINKKELL